jgi:hypothetical protein
MEQWHKTKQKEPKQKAGLVTCPLFWGYRTKLQLHKKQNNIVYTKSNTT